MSTTTKALSDCTHYELFKMLVPDFEECVKRAQAENPRLLQEIDRKSLPSGFRPFDCWDGGD